MEQAEERGRWTLAVAALTLVALLVGFAWLIVRTEQGSRRALDERFEARAVLTSAFVRQYVQDVAAQERRQAERRLAGERVEAATFAEVVASFDFTAALLLDGEGRVLQVWPEQPALLGTDMTRDYAHLAAAVKGQTAVSEIVPSAARRDPVAAVAVPFESAAGRRVFSGAFAPAATPLGAYFEATVPIRGGSGYLVDASGTVVASGGEARPYPAELVRVADGIHKVAPRGESLTAAVRKVRGTPWRVVLVAPTAALHAPVAQRQWPPWALWGALAVAGVAMFVLFDRLRRERTRAVITARTDELTGLQNRRAIQATLAAAASSAKRHGYPLVALMVDLDRFKEINDSHGHAGGDAVLRVAADRLRLSVRASDSVGRWGGEEFLVVLPHADVATALATAERIRQNVVAEPIATGVGTGPLTVSASIGLADLRDDVDDLLIRADAALYRAKAEGRNRCALAESGVSGR